MRISIGQAALAVAVIALGGGTAARSAQYDITWQAGASPVANVTAYLSAPDCTFRTSEHWSDFFPGDRGWASLIDQVSATDLAGRPLAVKPVTRGWTFGSGAACQAVVRYTVDFAFGRRSWEAGNEQVAYVDDRAVYTTGLPLFVLGQPNGPLKVRMRTPAGWAIATPWRPTGPGSFEVADEKALLQNTLVVGRITPHTFKAGKLNVTAVLLGDMDAGAAEVQAAFSRIVPGYVSMFADTDRDRYMVVVMPGPEDGESYTGSFAVTTRLVPSRANRIVWANHLAHELLHYWMGGKLAARPAEEDQMKWFTEGFTEYLANATLAQQHVLSEDQYLELMSRRLGAYLFSRENPNFANITPENAGVDTWRNRPLVYDGGAAIAFCLDATLRRRTGQARGLRDVMTTLYARPERTATYDDVVAASSSVAGQDMGGFFASYVRGNKTLDIASCAQDEGLEALVHEFDVFLRAPRTAKGAGAHRPQSQ